MNKLKIILLIICVIIVGVVVFLVVMDKNGDNNVDNVDNVDNNQEEEEVEYSSIYFGYDTGVATGASAEKIEKVTNIIKQIKQNFTPDKDKFTIQAVDLGLPNLNDGSDRFIFFGRSQELNSEYTSEDVNRKSAARSSVI